LLTLSLLSYFIFETSLLADFSFGLENLTDFVSSSCFFALVLLHLSLLLSACFLACLLIDSYHSHRSSITAKIEIVLYKAPPIHQS
jgi:hypothetical protein